VNPYAPPEAPAPDEEQTLKSMRGVPYFLLLVAFAGYCLAMERWVGAYSVKDMISMASIPQLPILCFLIGSGSLLMGVGRHVYAPWLGKHAFLLAAAVLAIGIAAAGDGSAFAGATRLLFGLGLAISLAGAWCAHRAYVIVARYVSDKKEGNG
jgi:hypothetical protein